MKTINSGTKLIAALSVSSLFLISGAAYAASSYRSMAGELAKAASVNGVSRIALGEFTSAGAGTEEARFASEKLALGLAEAKGLNVMDQATLEMQAGSKTGWMKTLPSKSRPQAFIKGSVFSENGDVTLIVKLVDSSTGRILRSAELTTRARFTELPPVPDINWETGPAVAPMKNDFRDAVADNGFCSGAFRKMDKINSAAVDLKARYWARKMKESGFVMGSLTRNPGSEIRDPQVRQNFYSLLTGYYEKDASPALAAAQEKKLEDFMGKESEVIDRCGIK